MEGVLKQTKQASNFMLFMPHEGHFYLFQPHIQTILLLGEQQKK
jgi:hypothetical protein